jgi:hypothetical protein
MQLKTLEVALSKEEKRMIDEYGNTASTWVRIGFTVELGEGDLPEACIALLRDEIQTQVDDWLLRQGGYLGPGDSIRADDLANIDEIDPATEGSAAIKEVVAEMFGAEAVITKSCRTLQVEVDDAAASRVEAGEDEIPV